VGQAGGRFDLVQEHSRGILRPATSADQTRPQQDEDENGGAAAEMPDMGSRSPKSYGGSPVSFYIYVENVDAAWKRAVDAGATLRSE
jgi:predicted enzyme related to lactoylglutathione lyase